MAATLYKIAFFLLVKILTLLYLRNERRGLFQIELTHGHSRSFIFCFSPEDHAMAAGILED